MQTRVLSDHAHEILDKLCVQIQNRRLGSEGNHQASAYFDAWMTERGFAVEKQVFDCQDWEGKSSILTVDEQSFKVFPSPHSLGCHIRATLVTADTLEALQSADARGKLLLLHGPIASSQIMPKDYPYYFPDEHRAIYDALEAAQPAAILTATAFSPQLAGALYPVPMIEDGNFDIPSVYLTEEEGSRLAPLVGQLAELRSEATRIPSHGWNSLARLNQQAKKKLVICAHIDARPTTPGALDNASGIVELMLLAELLKDANLKIGVELVSMNGEDHYAAKGEMVYLESLLPRKAEIPLVINIDGLGYHNCQTAYSFYECSEPLAQLIRASMASYTGLIEGEPWFQGDHSIFIQQGIPAMALTSNDIQDLLGQIIHTSQDKPEVIDTEMLAQAALALRDVVIALDQMVD